MKSFLLLTLCVFALLVSCKKKQTCECYRQPNGYKVTEQTYIINDRNVSRALTKCQELYAQSGTYNDSTTCTIK